MHWCVVSIAAVAVVAVIIRFLVRRITNNNVIITYVDEFVGNLCSGVFGMELGVIATMYGPYSINLLVAIFIFMFLKISYFMENDLYATPLDFIRRYYQSGKTMTFSMFFMITIIMTSMAGLYCGQKFVTLIWVFEDRPHIDALQVVCTTAMSYPWAYAALAEGSGVFVSVLVGFILPQRLMAAGLSLMIVTFIYFFSHVSGMFMNPIIATSLTFRCKGHQSDWQHFLVYWVTPYIATAVGWEVWLAGNRLIKTKVHGGKTE